MSQTESRHEPIAIIGMGCRFPGGATSPEAFWHLLHSGRDACGAIPPSRWDINAFYHPDRDAPGTMYVRTGYFLDDIDTCDPQFFHLAPREAAALDPQQRLALEVAWETLEDAGIAPSSLAGAQMGIFLSSFWDDYSAQRIYAVDPQVIGRYNVLSNLRSMLVGHIAHFLNVHGPAIHVDTACSSSLTAIHLACQSLRSGESDLALAGGVSLMLTPEHTIGLCRMGAVSADGRSKAFDRRADGFGLGEGCGMVVLKRVADAQADGDVILALIRGSAVNHDGQSRTITTPNGNAQRAVQRQALRQAGIAPQALQYVEAHGTGTELGDPIEVFALADTYCQERQEPLAIGSVKTNIGHTNPAAGVAGVIKVVLALHHEAIPPTLHIQELNPRIPWQQLKITVPTTVVPWTRRTAPGTAPRLAGVSGNGMSGVNAHIIIEEAPPRPDTVPALRERSHHLLPLSAKTPQALQDLVRAYYRYGEEHSEHAFADVCVAAATGRTHFPYRLAVVAPSAHDARPQLAAYAATDGASLTSHGGQPAPKIAFLFTGQGSQYAGMGLTLDATEPTFREAMDACAAILDPLLGRPLREILNDPAVIDQTTFTQPALFALEYALAQMWQAWGIAPDILIGHSVGELVAACVAGVFSLEDGLRLVAARGRLMGELPPDGEMVAIAADEAQVHTAIAPYAEDVSIAAVNGPTSVVISGRTAAVRAIAAQCMAEGLRTHALTVSHAFHSPLLEPMLDDFRAVAETITYHAPTRRLVSNLTGTLAGDEVTTPDYWVRHVREAVRFADGVTTLHAQGVDIFLEIGPKPVLLGMVGERPQPSVLSPQPSALLPSLRAGQEVWQTLLTSLGAMYVRGATIDWAGLHRGVVRRRVALPTYPFQRQRYWVDVPQPETPVAPLGLAGRSAANVTTQLIQHGGFTTDEQSLVIRALATLETMQQDADRDSRAAACTYTLRWQPAPVPARSSTAPGSWLIITDTGGVGDALAAQLRDQGATVALLSSAAVADAADLLGRPPSPEAPWRGLIYLGGLDAEIPDDADALMHDLERSLHPLLTLLPTIVALPAPRPRLWVVTQGAQAITTGDLRAPAQTPLWGMGRVIAREHSDIWGGLLDLDPADTPTAAAAVLLTEVLASGDEPQVAYRQGQRYVARLVRSQSPLAPPPRIVPQATYLITGGLGGLGLAVATWLADQGATNLVLTGRRGVTDDRQRVALDHLTSRGVAVRVESLDVTDAGALAHLLDNIAAGSAPLRGIVHAAGVLDDGILLNQTWERFAPVLAPKVAGAWLIHHLTRDMKLDLLVFFSSVSAVLGNPGQGTYAAANAFLDGLASYRQQQGLPAVSINWGAWAEAGMAARTAALRSDGMTPLPVELGVQALGRVLGTGGQLVVLDADWDYLQAQVGVSAPLLAELVTPTVVEHAVATPLREELAALPPRQRDERLRTEVALVVARILGMGEPPSPTTGLTDLGMDSLMALELRRSLERLAGEPLPVTVAFEYPTVAALATYLRDDVFAMATAPVPHPPTSSSAPSMTAPLAVVSMACRVPGAATPEAFWHLLEAGEDQVQEVPATRWPVADYYDPQRPLPGKVYTREGAFLEHVDQFEPGFFGIAPREAVGMDPQHRLLLEVSWEALERAGIAPATLSLSRTGVFIGIGEGEYGGLRMGQDLATMDSHAATSGGHSIAAGRLAYTLGLQGPTLAVDTACSSSLVAIHLACQSLRMGECDLALAGGVSLLLSPVSFVALAQMQALAPDGRCKTFDAAADGYGRGEGCGIVLLKRLADAERDGDTILAVVRGSAVNHDGPSSGLTVPNKQAQENLLRAALANAGVDAARVGYVEAHGTGTPLGDPIELRALGAVFAERESPLAVGSVKTNIGHLEAAAGIAGVIKTVLALQHGVIPPHLHLREPNPHVEWATLSLVVPTVSTPWGGDGQPRIAGVSAFGFSGTNAHVVLEAAPEESAARRTEDRPLHLLPIAAKDAAARDAYVQAYIAYLDANPEVDVGDLCATAQMGRSPFAHRLSVVAGSVTELRAQLETGGGQQGVVTAQQSAPKVAFLFTGQGSQYAGMGRELDATEPTFRDALDACAAILDPLLGRPLREILNDPAVIDQTTYTQPALFALEYALAQMWQAWGVEPDILIGHSVGELVAACIAGVFSLEDGLKLVAARGRLMGELPSDGEMVAIAADEARVRDAIAPYADDVSIAAVNGPTSVVISGRTAAVRAIAVQCMAEGLRTQSLTVSHAFHSPLLEPMLADFRAVAETITYHAPTRRLVSNLTGELVGAEVATSDYWVRHVREAVRFADGVTTLHAHGVDVFLEIGPKPVLLGMIGERPTSALSPQPSALLPSLRPNQPAWQTLLTSLGTLYVRGATIDWAGLHRDVVRRKIALPTYPFQRQRYWVDAPPPQRADALRPLVDRMVRVARRGETIFEKMVSTATLPFLADHQIYGTVVIPGAFHLAMALSGAGLLFDDAPCVVEDVIFPQVLALAPDEARTVQMIVTAGRDGHPATFEVISLDEAAPDAAEVLHATGRVGRAAETVPMMDIIALRARCPHALAPDDLYARIAATQVDLGPHFQWFAGIWTNGAGEALAQMRRPAALPEVRGYPLFPSLLDACFQLVAAAEGWDAAEGVPVTRVPFALERLTWYQSGDHAELWCSVVRASEPAGAPDARWDLTLGTAAGDVVATIQGLQLRAIPASAISGTRLRTDWLTTLAWEPQPIPTTQDDPPTCWLLVGATDALAAELAQTAPVTSLPVTVDATILRQQVDALAAQYLSLGVVFWGDVGCRSIIPNDGHSERSEESRSGPFASLRVDMRDGATSEKGNTATPAAALAACTNLLELSQVLSATTCAARLWVVTAGAQTVAGSGVRADAALTVGGSLWGFGRSLTCEEPRLHTVLVDLDASQSPEAQARTLAAELMTGAGGEVAWRGETRFVARMEPWRGRQDEVELRDLHPEASYLITGGLGALGLQIAEQLVADGARHLVLNSRRAAQTEIQRAALARLAIAGATVEVILADVGDAAEVQRLLARCATLGPLRGIIHAAGGLDDGVIAAQTPARLAGVMRPKAEGIWHLHQLSAGLDLDFFVGFSSLASLMGSAGQSTYAAANGFLDGLMQARRAQDLPGLSINWGPWAEVGMAAGQAEQLQRQGMDMISPAQGRALFRHIVNHTEGQIGVSASLRRVPEPLVPMPTLRTELLHLPEYERLPRLGVWLRQEVARILLLDGPELVEPQRPLFELGMDSLMAVDLRNRLNVTLGLSLHATLVFEYPTIESLSPWLLDQLRVSVGELDTSVPALPRSQASADLKTHAREEDIADVTDAELLAFINQKFDGIS